MERGVFCFIFFYEVAAVVLVLVVEDVVVEDPTSSTGSLPKRGFPTSPPPSLLFLETDSMDCIHDIPAVWVAQPLQLLQQYTWLLKHNSKGAHDPSSLTLHHFSSVPWFYLRNVITNVDGSLSDDPKVHRAGHVKE